MKTLGEVYREKILTRADLATRELPDHNRHTEIREDLFGWMLYSGDDFIECRSEIEARYLKVFLDAGVKEICVPQDDQYLASVLTELEKLKKRMDEIVNSYLESILDRRIRERLRYEVFAEMTK